MPPCPSSLRLATWYHLNSFDCLGSSHSIAAYNARCQVLFWKDVRFCRHQQRSSYHSISLILRWSSDVWFMIHVGHKSHIEQVTLSSLRKNLEILANRLFEISIHSTHLQRPLLRSRFLRICRKSHLPHTITLAILKERGIISWKMCETDEVPKISQNEVTVLHLSIFQVKKLFRVWCCPHRCPTFGKTKLQGCKFDGTESKQTLLEFPMCSVCRTNMQWSPIETVRQN